MWGCALLGLRYLQNRRGATHTFKKDGKRAACMCTVQYDLKMLNELELKGSAAHYI
ncbi:hypothetical protein [Borreliella burgdorferi]|uniref:hypothetical protein n=1 Tax=Borreliella burgdorferi TaxID=139 RepID=UPI003CEA5343